MKRPRRPNPPPGLVGPTGRFPRGKLVPDDEGELSIAITVRDGVVAIVFGKPVAWVGLPPALAVQLGRRLIQQAEEAMGPASRGLEEGEAG